MVQWAQCEDCFKWRRVPQMLFSPRDGPVLRTCGIQKGMSAEICVFSGSRINITRARRSAPEQSSHDADTLEALEGLDALANLAIMEVGETHQSSSQATTRHPRHRPGCTCIVCIQPPSGKGLKHKNTCTCTCNVCQTVKRRFRTQMLRREKRQSVKGAETACQKLQQPQLLEVPDDDIQLLDSDTDNSNPSVSIAADEGSDNDLSKRKSSTSPFKGQIDLNIQPEQEEEPSPVSNSGSMLRELYDATERYFRQQPLPSSGGSKNIVGNGTPVGSSHQNSDRDRPLSAIVSCSKGNKMKPLSIQFILIVLCVLASLLVVQQTEAAKSAKAPKVAKVKRQRITCKNRRSKCFLKEIIPNEDDGDEEACRCDGCSEVISGASYGCSDGCKFFLHKLCAELPPVREHHPLHPQHPLTLHGRRDNHRCDVCRSKCEHFTYVCSPCDFGMDIICASLMERKIDHPSHKHPLTPVRRKALLFCDACGQKHEGTWYQCTTCVHFWIHRDCASLPTSIERSDHKHPLTLSYTIPSQYATFYPGCDICRKLLRPFYWVYYCGKCRYFTHVTCVPPEIEPHMSLHQPGFTRQPKWGHLRDLHKSIKHCEDYLVNADPTQQSLGSWYEFRGFGKLQCFLATIEKAIAAQKL
ncbi:hypothetical protein RJ640_001953 [Escallonia rubra]|uniref:CW-type domain-containing protein n=1 Tax=Escallonia rubra TaxID=112253 RepID=A0AA88QWC9_9ASTE|nr:hypothetical protein RJ640_001953 [Escallonia rubra]